ncbi:MAG: glycosyltransferase family 39 protein, partial [Planctomycetota bacterium]|nr:glycosyltransferase family 39 protein [Planctomycetota bacterium]
MDGTADRAVPSSSTGLSGLPDRAWAQVAIVTAIWICAGLAGAGRTEISGPDEPRYADACRSMIESGDWIIPSYNGQPRLVKPILIYWLVSLTSLVLGGEVTPMSARLPASLSGLALSLSTLWIGRRLFGARVGLLAAVVLCATPLYAKMCRQALSDMTLAACVTTAMAGAVEARSAGGNMARRIFGRLVFYLFSGLGCLAKGPFLGMVLPIGITAFWLAAAAKATASLRQERSWIWGLPLCVAVGSSWYIAAGLAGHWDGVADFLLRQNLSRAVRPFDHQEAGHYYVKAFPMLFAPWILFLPAAAREVWIGGGLRWGRLPAFAFAFAAAFVATSAAAGVPSGNDLPGALYFLSAIFLCLSSGATFLWLRPVWRLPCFLPVVWFGVTFLALTAAGSKRGFYLLPLFPPAALLTAWTIIRLAGRLRAPAGTVAAENRIGIACQPAEPASVSGEESGTGWGGGGEGSKTRSALEHAREEKGITARRPSSAAWDARMVLWPLAVLGALALLAPLAAFVFQESLGSPEEISVFLGFAPAYAATAAAGAAGVFLCVWKKAPAAGAYTVAAAAVAVICWTYAAVAPRFDSLRGTADFCRRVGDVAGDRRLLVFAFPCEAEIVWHLRRTVSDAVREAGLEEEARRLKTLDRTARR